MDNRSDTLVIRPSSLADFSDCPRRWAARHLRDLLEAAGYRLGARRPSHIGASVGTGLHAGAAHTLTARLQTGMDPAEQASEEVAIVEMRARMETEGVMWDELTKDSNTAERQLRRMMRAWRRHIAPGIRPVLVEERLEVEVADGIIMSGQLDLADGNVPQGVRIRDNKTTKQKRSAHVQLGAYGLLLHSHGHHVAGLAVDHVPRVPMSDEQPVPATYEIAVHDAVEAAMQAVEDIGRCVAEFRERAAGQKNREPISVFGPNPSSPLCNARWCPAHGTNACRAHV